MKFKVILLGVAAANLCIVLIIEVIDVCFHIGPECWYWPKCSYYWGITTSL